MKILKIDDPKLKSEVLNTLSQGGVFIYPTETCYGVGVDATNNNAVVKVLEYKKRPEGKAISIAVDSEEMASKYVEINETAKQLYKNFLPGPVTIISKSKGNLDKRLESENTTLGVRIPAYKVLLDIIHEFGKPITATSANSLGKKTPYTIEDILNNISEKQRNLIDLIIDAGQLPHNPPSTVIDTTTEQLVVYRSGRVDPTKFELIDSKITESEEETIQFAEEIVSKFQNNLYLLNGELGAGKTHFVKGIAKKLGIDQIIKSPTYNYVNEYSIESAKLIHFDAWRIQSSEDLTVLGFYDWLNSNNIVVIEWPTVVSNIDSEIFEQLNDYLYIDFLRLDGSKRDIRVYRKLPK